MLDDRLTPQELAERRAARRATRDVGEAYRINAAILLGKGCAPADVANALLIDPDSARKYFKRYKKGGVDGLLRMRYGGAAKPCSTPLGWRNWTRLSKAICTHGRVRRPLARGATGSALHRERHDRRAAPG